MNPGERVDTSVTPQAYASTSDAAESTPDADETFANLEALRVIWGGLPDTLSELDWPPHRPVASPESLAAARELGESSRRRIDTPVRKSFVRPRTTASAPVAPLAEIYSGGRSGVVAVKLLLALLWRCSAPPFSTDKPARAWATLLDLEDPEGKGARRIKAALRTLEAAKLVRVVEQPGYPNVVTLLDESGTGRSYGLPSTAYSFATKNALPGDPDEEVAANTYFKVPQQLWREGFIQTLRGPGLVMLLILLAERGGDGAKVWFATNEFPQRYNISAKTRAAGTKELIELGLLKVEAESLAQNPWGSTFDVRRRRKVYRLTAIAQTKTTAAERTTSRGKRRRRSKTKS